MPACRQLLPRPCHPGRPAGCRHRAPSSAHKTTTTPRLAGVHLCGRGVGQQLVAGQLVLLLHGAAEDLLHAAADHGHRRHDEPQQVVPHRKVGHRPVKQEGCRLNLPESAQSTAADSSCHAVHRSNSPEAAKCHYVLASMATITGHKGHLRERSMLETDIWARDSHNADAQNDGDDRHDDSH